jgi:hypothetical protein
MNGEDFGKLESFVRNGKVRFQMNRSRLGDERISVLRCVVPGRITVRSITAWERQKRCRIALDVVG